MAIRKFELEAKLKDDNQLIRTGVLRNDHPFDSSPEFLDFLQACRRGDLKRCQELISAGVNINAKDQFDYTPLVVVSSPPCLTLELRLTELGQSMWSF
jgi:ankyrin repeat protein